MDISLQLINRDSGLKNKITPILSNRAKRELEIKNNNKIKIIYGLQIKHENIVLRFD